MPTYIVVEKILRSHVVTAADAETARTLVESGEINDGEDYEWTVLSVDLDTEPSNPAPDAHLDNDDLEPSIDDLSDSTPYPVECADDERHLAYH